MEEARIFQILGMDPCRDEEKIREAYRVKLTQVHPEEDPEGFMELRRAYEEGCRLAQKGGEEEQEEDLSPSGQWAARVAQVYGKLSDRIDTDKWKELFADPVLVELEQEERCNEKLLGFLMDHFRLPAAIWKLVDGRLHMVENRERLYENYPRDFVDFCVAHCKQQGDDMAYELFEGEEEAEYDLFIRNYFDVMNAQENGKTEEAARILEQAAALHIYHPHMELARMVQMEQEGKKQEARELAESLLEKYPEDETVAYQTAELYFRLGERDRWPLMYRKMKEKNDHHYMANYRLSSYYLETGEYEKAKKCAEEVMENPVGEEFQEVVQAINQKLEESLEQGLKENPADLGKRLELGWCYLQDEKTERIFTLLDGIVPTEEKEREFESLLAKAAFSIQDYPTAREHLSRWLPLLEKQIGLEDGEEKAADLGRIGTAHWMLSRILREEAKQEKGQEADSDQSGETGRQDKWEQALAELELAVQADSASFVNYQYEKAQLLHEMKRDAECVDLCGMLLAEYRFWPAYVAQQEAYEALRDAGGVIECYQNLVSLYPGYTANYEKAAEIYWDLDRYDDLKSVLEEAERNEAASARLSLFRCKQLRIQADSRAQMEQALAYAKSLEEEFKKNESKAVIAALYAEFCYCEQRLGSLNDAFEHIGKAIALDPDRLQYRLTRAEVLTDGGKADQALPIYKECEAYFPNNAYFYCHFGECYSKLGQMQEAMDAYEKSLALSPEQAYVYEQLVRICTVKLRQTCDLSWYEKGKVYADKLIECNKIDYNYWVRGILETAACDYEQAEQDYRQAIEMDENDWVYYNDLGCVYQYTEQYEKAERYFRKASELADLAEDPRSLRNLSDTYQRMGRPQDALDCLKRLESLYLTLPDKEEDLESIYQDMKDVYQRLQELDKATEYLHKSGEGESREEFQFLVQCGDFAGAEAMLCRVYDEKPGFGRKKKEKSGIELCKSRIDRGWLFYTQGRFEEALKYFRKAVEAGAEELPDSTDEFDMLCDRAGYCCLKLGLAEEEKEWGRRALCYMDKQEGGIEGKEKSLGGRMSALFDLLTANAHAGHLEKAKAYLEQMRGLYKCRSCPFVMCVDRHEAEGLLAELEGDTQKAIALYQEVVACTPSDADVVMKLAVLTGSGGQAAEEAAQDGGEETPAPKKRWFFRKKR